MKTQSFALKPFILLITLVLFISFCFDTTAETLKNPAYLFVMICALILIFTFRKSIKRDEMTLINAVMIAGIVLKTAYVLYTAVWTRQHDVIDFGAPEGHAAYIEYIYFNNALPVGDPREKWAFFQPPLHHIIAAVWMKVCNKFIHTYRQIQENVQALTLFYTGAAEVFTLFICKELKLKQKGILAAMLLVSFHPVYVIMSGSINNDALALMYSVITLYVAILWYRKPTYLNIIILALSLGLSMFAKLSGGMTAPAVAFIFLIKLIREVKSGEKKALPKLILQYVIFALIVFPLGIGWEIRNMILYKMPFNYIPPVGELFENRGLVARLFDLRMDSVYPAMVNYGKTYDEFNVFLLMFKTAVFDEYDLSLLSRFVNPTACILFVTSVILALTALFATVRKAVLVAKNREFSLKSQSDADLWIMMIIYYVTMLAAYFMFALSHADFSAGSFRYISPVIIVEAFFLAGLTDDMEKKTAGRILFATLALFAVSSLITYAAIGF
ncbi:MAG: glycosyltransferase family 39 protein [Lachnospiraceae bacterium]|nr:glycosyltransferase family 39 protein [Lachnospiraceae bacterium]